VRGVHRHPGERLLGGEAQLGTGERRNDGEAFAEGAPGVEVGRERDDRSGVDERAGGRHRPVEVQRRHGEQHGRDTAASERCDAVRPRRLEMVDRPGAELERKRDRSHLGELVSVESERKPRPRAGFEIPPCWFDPERASLDEHVRRDRGLRCGGQHFRDRPVDVCGRVGVLGRDGVGAEPRRDAAGRGDSQRAVPLDKIGEILDEAMGRVRRIIDRFCAE